MKKWLIGKDITDSINWIRVKENEKESLSIDVYEQSHFIVSLGEKYQGCNSQFSEFALKMIEIKVEQFKNSAKNN